MIEQLFGSKTRVKLLYLFFSNPNRPFYVREITRKVDEQINSVRRELANLLAIGIISSDTANNKLFYEVNQKYNYYKPLAKIFSTAPISGESSENTMGQTLQSTSENFWINAGQLDLVIYTGSFTRDTKTGVDIIIVGDASKSAIVKLVESLEKQEGRELKYVLMTTEQAIYRNQINDRFWADLVGSKKQVIINKNANLIIGEINK